MARFQLAVTIPYDLALFEPSLKPADQPSTGEPHGYLGLNGRTPNQALRSPRF